MTLMLSNLYLSASLIPDSARFPSLARSLSLSVHQSKIPLGLVIQAMAIDLEEKDGGLEVVNFGAMVSGSDGRLR